MHLDNCITSLVRTTITSTCLAAVGVVALAGSAQADGSETPYSRPCFLVRAHWNVALDGPQPLCPAP